MRAYENIPRQSMRKRGFDRNGLPPAADYYQPIFRDLQFNANGWAQRPVSSPINEKGPVRRVNAAGSKSRKRVSRCQQANLAWDIAHVLKERSDAGAH
jgi:hypothetical protein